MSLDVKKEPQAIIVPDLPKRARRKRVITQEGFSILLYLKDNVPYVKLHFANDSGGLHDVVLKVKGTSSMEEALLTALRELKMGSEVKIRMKRSLERKKRREERI